MNRNDRIVGMDGTAQGRMNSTASTRIHQRSCTKKPDRNSAIRKPTTRPPIGTSTAAAATAAAATEVAIPSEVLPLPYQLRPRNDFGVFSGDSVTLHLINLLPSF